MSNFRPTAIPLVTVDPYFSIWSFTDKLYDDVTRHWSGKRAAMTGMIAIDGKYYRFMGKMQIDEYLPEPPIIEQSEVKVFPTKTVYIFENDIILINLTFRTPLLLDNPNLMSRPVSYISYDIRFKDGKKHNIEIYFDISAEICSENAFDEVEISETTYSVCCGKGNRDVLLRSGDNIKIEWGKVHLVFDGAEYFSLKHNAVTNNRKLLKDADTRATLYSEIPFIGAVKKYTEVNKVSDFLCVAYDDIYSIEYFGEKLEPYWKKDFKSFKDLIQNAVEEYEKINRICEEFDSSLIIKANTISDKYTDIVSLAYRQAVSGHKLTENDGKLLYFSKECFSNGCIATVDITYPSMPLFLIYNADLLEGMLNPVFEYAEGNHGWNYRFAPHDVGQYPIANGQVYGYNSRTREMHIASQMPVEECGNMLICTMALCRRRNDYAYAAEHKSVLNQWADYLVEIGFDPENQLCTDDFAGHLAHNCNLSVKGILGIAAYGKMLFKMGGDGKYYTDIAKRYAKEWQKKAFAGDRYALTFDKHNTWSIKYNLVWDKLLDLNIFDKDIFETEVSFYKTKMNKYGIPLDSREDYTKSDWQMWSVCLADDEEYQNMVITAMWDMLCDIRERVPFPDLYYTSEACMKEFQCRTVQGGLFMPIMDI